MLYFICQRGHEIYRWIRRHFRRRRVRNEHAIQGIGLQRPQLDRGSVEEIATETDTLLSSTGVSWDAGTFESNSYVTYRADIDSD